MLRLETNMHGRKILLLPVVGWTILVGGCAAAATKPDAPAAKDHVDIAYAQFVLSAEGTQPYDLSSLPQVPAECGAAPTAAAPAAGGVALLAPVLTALISKIASTIGAELEKWVDAEVAKYSSDVSGKPTRVGFYSSQLWFRKTGSQDQYSCFVIALNKCAASTVDQNAGVCPVPPGQEPRILIVGQYKLTGEDLQVRPLFGRVRGFDAKRNESEKEASIAATLKFESVWWDGHEGHTEPPTTVKVLAVKFAPTDQDPGIDLAFKHKNPDAHSPDKYLFADWDTLPLLPRPPRSPGSEGTVAITPEVAESNTPPKGLTLIKKVLGDNSSQISDALKSALDSLCGKECAASSTSGSTPKAK
jgi:hypothetical protein